MRSRSSVYHSALGTKSIPRSSCERWIQGIVDQCSPQQGMSLPRNIRLLTSIVFVSLLTSLFLLVQMCLLDVTCHNGLSVMAARHRRLLTLYGRNEKGDERLDSVESSENVTKQNITRRDILYQVSFTDNVPRRMVNVEQSAAMLSGGNTTANVKNITDDNSAESSDPSLSVRLNTSHAVSTTTSSTMSLSTIPITTQPQNQQSTATRNAVVSSQYSTPEGRQGDLFPSSPLQPHFIQIPKPAASMLQFSQGQTTLCKLSHCMEYFSYLDKICYEYCQKKQRTHLPSHSSGMYGECKFMNGNKRAAVALASLPGSGNTWIRGLLEKATGICTGAVYCDVYLKEAGFNGEGLRSGSVLVVKTHKANVTWTDLDKPENDERGTPSYGAVVLLIRNPYHAMVAEWNREAVRAMRKLADATTPQPQDTIHTASVGPEHFGDNPAWSAFIHQKVRKWLSYVDNIILGAQGRRRLVVHYEDFQRDRVEAVTRVLKFLYFPYEENTLRERLQDDFEVFHRQSHPRFEHFTKAQVELIQQALMGLLGRLREGNNGITYGIEDYLR